MIERKFIAKGTRKMELEDYLEKSLSGADYSHSVIKRTPLSTRIMIYAGRPGMVIGRSGAKIKELTEVISKRFEVSNPQIEVGNIEGAHLDAVVIAKQIAYSLERGTKYRRVVNIMLKNIMSAGALGVEVCLAGKVSGARKRTEKFMRGNLKKSGHSRDICTNYGQTTANLRPGVIGIKVRIMHSLPDVLLVEKRLKAILEKPVEEEEKAAPEKGKKDATIELVKAPAAEAEEKDAGKKEEPTKDEAKPKDEKKKDHTVKEEAPKKEPVKEKAKPVEEKKESKAKPEEKAEEKPTEPAAKKEEEPVKEENVPEKADDAVVEEPADDAENKASAEKESSSKKGE
ncbi:MAG: 30S ribosomal protein S3 [Candidatus Aenigmarchaeota archaeon]|nr:30S ribosomal protein S3 [Candidatus Aenigmarchaeota archaeon]